MEPGGALLMGKLYRKREAVVHKQSAQHFSLPAALYLSNKTFSFSIQLGAAPTPPSLTATLAACLCQYHLPVTLFPAPILSGQHPSSAQRLPAFGQNLGSKSWAGSWERTTPKHTTAEQEPSHGCA